MATPSSTASHGASAPWTGGASHARGHAGSTAGTEGTLVGPLRDLLLNSCLLAASRGFDDAVAAMRPVLAGLGMDAARLAIAIAMVQLRSGRPAACLATLEQDVLSREPGHELALAVQATAWQREGNTQGRRQAQALLATSADPLVRRVLQSR